MLNYPLERKLEILGEGGNVIWRADVEEREEDGDESGKYAHAIGAWHGLSKGGDVTVMAVFDKPSIISDLVAGKSGLR